MLHCTVSPSVDQSVLVIAEFVDGRDTHAITMADIPNRAKVKVIAEEKAYRQLSLTVNPPGLVTQPTKVTVSVHSDDVSELKMALLKALELPVNIDCEILAVSYPLTPKIPSAEQSERYHLHHSVYSYNDVISFRCLCRVYG